MANRLAIFHPRGELGLGQNFFGKDVANLELFRAMAQHGGFERLDVLSVMATTDAALRAALLNEPDAPIQIHAGSGLNMTAAREAGTLLRGQPDLQDLAWLRRISGGDRSFSLIGLVHTLAPPAVRVTISQALTAPVHPWDAVICTSPSVRDAVCEMFDQWGDYLGERTGGGAPPRPALPVIPLGVEARRFADFADRPEARAKVRAQLGVADEDVLVLWVGRLSFFEKAFPQSMFKAIQQAGTSSGVRLHFAMAGWFPGGDRDRGLYEEAAKRHAPDVLVHFLNGNDRELVSELWAGADIFTSLVDNIQETFGITPVEAMAAGLPVVVSDWDGYRFTVRDGVDGMLIPTLGGPRSGFGGTMVQRHLAGIASYQAYVGEVAQYTAVHVGRAAEAIAALARSPDLRRKMGAAGRARVAATFDWPVVARQISALTAEMSAIRAASPDPVIRQKADPVRGDPFVAFAGFPSQVFTPDTRLKAAPGVDGDHLRATIGGLDEAFANLRSPMEECAQALDLLASGQAASSREVLAAFPVARRRMVEMGLAWMCKLGLIDWLA